MVASIFGLPLTPVLLKQTEGLPVATSDQSIAE